MSIPLQYFQTGDTTLRHVHLQQALKAGEAQLAFLRRVNRVLLFLVLSTGVWLLAGLFTWQIPTEVAGPILAVESDSFAPVIPDKHQAWAQLTAAIKRRNIFEPVAAVAQAQANVYEQEFLQRIRIVGVMLDAAPKAIIEVIDSGETVFAGEGDAVIGAVIQKILERKVVLRYNGLELELNR